MDEIFTNLDESLAQINMILGSRFVKPLREEAEVWKKNIQILSDMVDEWLKCQRQTLYLRPIFAAKDIQKILNEEAKQFTRVDTKFKTLMKKVDKAKNCLKFVKQFPVTLEELKKNNTILDDCNKKLEDYMNQKRTEFPRFFFLSNDELIDILANS
jgi:dynein heavy chain